MAEGPYLEILEQPQSSFRFRYSSEGPSHGGISGESSDKTKKTFPCVAIHNYRGQASIVVQLVTAEEKPRLHPNSLVGKQCDNGICTVQCQPPNMTATFTNLSIEHAVRKNVPQILRTRQSAFAAQLLSRNGYSAFGGDIKTEAVEHNPMSFAEIDPKSIDLSVVKLMFIAYIQDNYGNVRMLQPVCSKPIAHKKINNGGTLRICRMSHTDGKAIGGDEILLFCDKVCAEDIEIRFFEEDITGKETWEGRGIFSSTDVHKQFGIAFKTPRYKNPNISTAVEVKVQLYRPSSNEASDPRPFTFLPVVTDKQVVQENARPQPNFYTYVDPSSIPAACSFTSGARNWPSSCSGRNNIRGVCHKAMKSVKKSKPQIFPLPPEFFRSSFSQTSVQRPSAANLPSTSRPPVRNSSNLSMMARHGSLSSVSSISSSKSNVELPTGTMYQPPVVQPNPMQYSRESNPSTTCHDTQFQPVTPQYCDNSSSSHSFGSPADSGNGSPPQSRYVPSPPNAFSPPSQTATAQNPAFLPHQNNTQLQFHQGVAATGRLQADRSSFMPCNYLVHADGLGSTGPAEVESLSLDNVEEDIVNTAIALCSIVASGDADPETQPMMINEAQVSHHEQQMTVDNYWGDVESDAAIDVNGHQSRPSSGREAGDYTSVMKPDGGSLSDYLGDEAGTSSALVQADAAPSAILNSTTTQVDHPMKALSLDETPTSKQPELRHRQQRIIQTSTTIQSDARSKAEIKPSSSHGQHPSSSHNQRGQRTKAIDKGYELLKALREKWASALQSYSASGDVRLLLVSQRHLTSWCDESGNSVLHTAVVHGQLEALSCLLDVISTMKERRDIIDVRNKQQQTALHLAAMADNVGAVIELLKHGANPLAIDKHGNNVMHVASRHGNADILSRALNSKRVYLSGMDAMDIRNYSGYSCFHLTVFAPRLAHQCLQLLSDTGFHVNTADTTNGRTALHMAVEENKLDVAMTLVKECNADISAATYSGHSALHLAASRGCYKIASFLLARGADPELSTKSPDSDERGETPIDLAVDETMRSILRSPPGSEPAANHKNELRSLDPLLKTKLCKLLNVEQEGADWGALADRLQLTSSKTHLRSFKDPTEQLIELYQVIHGTADGLRSALLGIGRHDAVQLLNRALKLGVTSKLANARANDENCQVGST